MLGREMIDEASRKMALVVSGKGRAAAMKRTVWFDPAAEDGRTSVEPSR
jgi:citrate lyase subunit beta/citryl-CoA lyase